MKIQGSFRTCQQRRKTYTKLGELPNIKMLIKDTVDMNMFQPRILVSDVSDSGVTLSIRLWIREVNKKDEIISEFLEDLLKKFKEEKTKLK
jgi:small conductance mechanosensitive channel